MNLPFSKGRPKRDRKTGKWDRWETNPANADEVKGAEDQVGWRILRYANRYRNPEESNGEHFRSCTSHTRRSRSRPMPVFTTPPESFAS